MMRTPPSPAPPHGRTSGDERRAATARCRRPPTRRATRVPPRSPRRRSPHHRTRARTLRRLPTRRAARRPGPLRVPPGRRPHRGHRGRPAMKTPVAPPIPEELTVALRRMRLPYVRAAAPEVLATARAQRWDPAEVLRVLLVEEIAGRDAATRRQRRKSAAFPSGKTLASWKPQESSIPEATQNALTTLEWVHRHENLVLAGASGTGKSHFVEALAHKAIDKDLRVAWFTLESLTATLARAKVDGSVARTVSRICRVDLIVIDDIGMLPA